MIIWATILDHDMHWRMFEYETKLGSYTIRSLHLQTCIILDFRRNGGQKRKKKSIEVLKWYRQHLIFWHIILPGDKYLQIEFRVKS